jgi:hypothetical protein
VMEPQGLSPGEEQLWFLDQLDPHEPAYNVPMLFDLRGPLDRRLLSAAVTTVFSTFEAFTMTYPTKDGIPQRVCRPDLPLAMPLAFRRDPQPAKFVRAEIRRPFSLQTGPLARGYLISVDVDHHLLLLVFHHIIVDSDSLRVVIRSLSDTYAALRNSDAPPPGPTSVRYAEFGAWQRGQAVAPGARDFWLAELVDAPARTAFPSVSSNGQSPFSGGAVRRVRRGR